MFYAHVTPREEFTSETIDKCVKIALSLGKAGRFHYLSTVSYGSRKDINERIHSEEMDFKGRELRRVIWVEFKRSAFPPAELKFDFAPQPDYLLWNPPFLLYKVHEDHIKKGDDRATEKLLAVFKRWVITLKAYFGDAYLGTYERIGDWPASRPLGSPIPITDLISSICWATYFGPELVERLGRDKLLAAPAYRVETMETGGILILLTPRPIYAEDPAIHDIQLKVMQHLGLKLLDKHPVRDALRQQGIKAE